MRPRKIIRTTGGELIVAVTDEVFASGSKKQIPIILIPSAVRFDWS